ncbi:MULTISPECIES: NAD(P)H-hydrate dehydratase [unclassified Sphingomonas]|uniref:NAD(P)H-hydrate dehydratase n=1 Tax=unclassified Sphingomonas TaxID=196159 RepID=UPI00226A9FCC|nr:MULTISPECIES: NAD(P)H-hydrate dehydratase [unclassified Sphingomonas]
MILLAGQPILTAAEMRAAEAASGIAVDALMARAGAAIADAVRRLAAGAEVLMLCGPGNNGGDGYVAATRLAAAGLAVRVAAAAPPRSAAAEQARAGWTGPVEAIADAAPAPVLVDALFGTGLTRPLDDALAADLRRLATAARLVIAVDLPSGVVTDDGALLGEPPRCHVTLALGAAKPAHLLQPAARYAGAIRLLDIGVSAKAAAKVIAPPSLKRPGPDSHKYSRGMVAVVPGSMAGAGEMAAIAALRAGAGYALLLTDTPGAPHAIVRKAFNADALANDKIGAVVIGPGLGRDDEAAHRVGAAFAGGRPLVIDGDALHIVDIARMSGHSAAMILTPHGGEFAALFGTPTTDKITATRAAAKAANAVVIHKGADTVIAAPDGRVTVAGDANDWLSTAGSGDVLAGTTGAMLAAGGDPFAAAEAAVWLHAEAARRSGAAFIADDLAEALTPARASL